MPKKMLSGDGAADHIRRDRLLRALVEIVRVARHDEVIRGKLIDAAAQASSWKLGDDEQHPMATMPAREGRPIVWTLERSLGFLATYYTLQQSGHFTERGEVLAELGRIFKVVGEATIEKRIKRCLKLVRESDPEVAETVRAYAPDARMRPRRKRMGT